MSAGPLDSFISFWKPLSDGDSLSALAAYRIPGESLTPGITAWQPGSQARRWQIIDGEIAFSIFAAVEPIDTVPTSAEVVAEILDPSGDHYSYVLRFPAEGSVVLPFDPNAAIDSFRRETYVPEEDRTALPQPILNLYYSFAKPLVPSGLKRWLRSSIASRALASESALRWPIDESLDDLQRFLMRVVLIASDSLALRFAWFWPNGHPWAAVLTHDVETGDGLPSIRRVTEVERKRGLRSSFNFVPVDYEVPESLLRELRGDGFEVGVHGYTHDGLLFSSWSTFQKRVLAINEYGRRLGASGFRSPATYRNPEWFHLLEFDYDSSFSNTSPCEPQPGGCGSLFPYPIDGLTEIPITLPQDHTLFELLRQSGCSTWLSSLERIRLANGMACVLTHPDPSSGYIGFDANMAHYEALLDVVAASDAWTPLPRDLARWWRARADTPPERLEDMPDITYGSATLDPAGRLAIVAPAATQAEGATP